MQQLELFAIPPETKLLEFLLVLNTPPDVESQVIDYKKAVERVSGSFKSRHSRPHITLGKFGVYSFQEHQLIDSVTRTAALFQPFELNLRDFDHFNGTVIYIDVVEKETINELQQWLRVEQKRSGLKLPSKLQVFPNKPHLTIARGIEGADFEAAWRLFENQTYKNHFDVQQLTLLKRTVKRDVQERYEKAAEVPLGV